MREEKIHKTFKGDSIRNIDSDPEFAVVFTDKSVQLLSQNRNDYTEKEVQVLKKMDQLVAAMEQEGITLEVCLFALDYFDVGQKSVTKAVTRVPNGWISTIGYQSRGYSLVPVY